MASWTSGYVAELGYGHDFNAELTPELLRFAGLARGIRAPVPGAPLSYCELGCSQGFSSSLLAAANPHVAFHAVDFNPAHIATAQALAARVGTPNVCFHELAFDCVVRKKTSLNCAPGGRTSRSNGFPRWSDMV